MSGTEYLLAAMVIVVPLLIAVMVTLWTLEQARMRNRKNRPKPVSSDDEATLSS